MAPALDLDLVADFDLPGQHLRIRATGAKGDVVERDYALRLSLWRSQGIVTLTEVPWVETPRDIHDTHVSSPPDLAQTDIYATTLTRSTEPYQGPDTFEIIRAFPEKIALSERHWEPRAVDLPADLTLLPYSHDRSRVELHQTRWRETASLDLDPSKPLCVRASLFLGQQRPDPDRLPDGEDRSIIGPGDLAGPNIGTPIMAVYHVDPALLDTQGAWVLLEWLQDDERLLFRGYRLPPRKP